jgi:hypothetical protein
MNGNFSKIASTLRTEATNLNELAKRYVDAANILDETSTPRRRRTTTGKRRPHGEITGTILDVVRRAGGRPVSNTYIRENTKLKLPDISNQNVDKTVYYLLASKKLKRHGLGVVTGSRADS